MKLLPFILRFKETDMFVLYNLTLFLSHAGRSLWETETPGLLTNQMIQQEYCNPNGFVVDSIKIHQKKQIAFIQVNPEKTKMEDFFSWDEALKHADKPECWRTFTFFLDKDKKLWWSPKGLVEAELQGGANVQEIFEEIYSWSKDTLQI